MSTAPINSTAPSPKWCQLQAEDVLAKLQCEAEGLSTQEAAARLHKYGPNRLPPPATRSGLRRFIMQFHNILIYVLLVSVLITFLLDHWVDSGVILAVVIANALIGFIQEGKAEKAMDAIRHMLAPHASVLRDGQRHSIAGEAVVPGDVVLLEAGDKVPADMRLLSAHGLQIQEAILTGESVPVDKSVGCVADAAALGDQHCMAFSGTLVSAGQGKAVVVATGTGTEIGRISGLLAQVETLTTPLVLQMNRFAKWLTLLILLIGLALLVYGYYAQDYNFSDMFMVVVGLSVAAIPEGLPAVLTITLAIGVQAMAKRHAIIRRLPAIETLGSVSVICTDKTGTLTRNEMTVAMVLTAEHCFALDGEGYSPEGILRLNDIAVAPAKHGVMEELARAAVLCNDAALHVKAGQWQVEGDPMEGALVTLAMKAAFDPEIERAAWPRLGEIPFDAEHRFMATLHKMPLGQHVVLVKGAPEAVLAMCSQQECEDGARPLDTEFWLERIAEAAVHGERVLGFAMRHMPVGAEGIDFPDVEKELTFLGIELARENWTVGISGISA